MKLKVGKALTKAGWKLRKHSPEILVVVGVGGVVVSTVAACKATTKLEDVLDETKSELDDIRNAAEELDEKEAKKALTKAYFKGAWRITKLYGPCVLGEAASIGCILGSHHIMKKRFDGVVAAYNLLDASFKGYRKRVIEKIGEAKEREIRYGIEKREFEEVTVDKNGNEKTKTVKVDVADPNSWSVYARFFDEGCAEWEKDPEYNLMFLHAQQEHANDLLNAKGHLFLNEVYAALGIPVTKEGQVVGWVKGNGDGFVDFGIYDINKPKNRDFVNGYEKVILLDFNVDGYILDKI